MSDHGGIVFECFEALGVGVAKGDELGVENERAVAWVAGVAGFLTGAAAQLAVAGHEGPREAARHGGFGSLELIRIRPCAEGVEAVGAEHSEGFVRPSFGVSEFLLEGLPATARVHL